MADSASLHGHRLQAGPRLESLTSLRFFAALAVVILHITVNRAHDSALVDLGAPFGRLAELGYLGVTFFFTLSGFVLTWSASGRRVPVAAFYRRRFARVYPMHLVTALLAGAAALAATGAVTGVGTWAAVLLLVQAWVPDSNVYFGLNGVSWSLSCEAFFYAMTPLLLFWAARRSTRTIWIAAGVVTVGISALAVLLLATTPIDDQDVWVSPWFSISQFMVGMALALTFRRGIRRWPSLRMATFLLVGTIVMIMALSVDDRWPRWAAALLLLPAVVLLIGGAAQRDLTQASGWLTKRLWVRLGEWSFALYLVHLLLVRALRVVGLPTLTGPAAVAGLIAFVALAVGCSGLAYVMVERPAERRLRGARRAEQTA